MIVQNGGGQCEAKIREFLDRGGDYLNYGKENGAEKNMLKLLRWLLTMTEKWLSAWFAKRYGEISPDQIG